MIRHIKTFFLLKSFRDFNNSEFKKIKNKKSDNIVLIEFNSFHVIHIIFAYFSFFFKKKNYTIKSFYSHILLTYQLKPSLRQKIFRFISPLFNLGFYGIYKSFGVRDFIFPKITKNNQLLAEKKFKEIQKNLNKKEDILQIYLENIFVGDLIYDSYLTRNDNQQPTIDISKNDFKIYLFDFIKLFYFWFEFFRKNKIKAVLATHGIYTMGIPIRIALNRQILSLEVKENRLKRLTNKNLFYFAETEDYPKIFPKLEDKQKVCALKVAKERLEQRFMGSSEDIPYVTRSAFANISTKTNQIEQNEKIKVLILPHDFIDAPHCGGLFPFPDMYDWIKFLADMSNKKTEYDWYLKTHPIMGDKWEWYQKFTRDVAKKLITNSRIKTLHPNTTHNEIISANIDYVLTIFGTAAHEYAFKNVKVINGGEMNPHFSYKFNLNVSNYSDYLKTINNLDQIKFDIDQNKVLEFYYMHFIYSDKNWFFDYDDLLKNIENYHFQWSEKVYEYWIKNSKKKKNFQENFDNKIQNFIDSRELVFTIDHKKQK